MSRPARKLSPEILRTLDKRAKLRYTLTSRGVKAFETGETEHSQVLDSLVEAIQANNKQPVSLLTWKRFHQPKDITNRPLKELVESRLIRIVSRGKFTMAVE